MSSEPKRRLRGWKSRADTIAALLTVGQLCMAANLSRAEDGPAGITTPLVLSPFNPAAPSCNAPPALKKILAFAEENDRKFLRGVDHGLAMAARDRGLEYQLEPANSNAEKQVQQVNQLLAAKVGAVVVAPVDPASLGHSLQQIMWAGAYIGAVVPPPATTILNAPQYLTGKVLGDAAANYIKDHLGGNADVVLLTQDSLEFLAPRFAAIRDSLKDLPGVNIVADISPSPVNEQGGFATMTTILEAHPDVDVVLGADTVVLGALKALRTAGKDRPDQYLGGIDGEPDAVAEIKKGDGPYKASIALSSPVFGYALGQLGADWLEGKSVPQAMDILPMALTVDNIARYEMDLVNPGAVYSDPSRRALYLRMYGNICYDNRDQYLNFPWSSETR